MQKTALRTAGTVLAVSLVGCAELRSAATGECTGERPITVVMLDGSATQADDALLAAGCGSVPTATSTSSRWSAVTTLSTVDVRTGLPAVAGDDRQGIPRVNANDAAPPLLDTRTTVLENHRPALVVTLSEAVLFPFGSAELRPEAEAPMHGVVDLLGQHPGAAAEVAGHTDSVGSSDYNRTLSQQRAAAVVDWLVARGVPGALLRPVGYGATRPVAGNATDEERRRNRRVEITVQTPEKERRK